MADEPMVTNSELAQMCRQFSTLTAANVNVLDIFDTLEAQTENPFLKEVLQKVREHLEMGHTLATAFNRYPNTFSPFFITIPPYPSFLLTINIVCEGIIG